MKPYLYSRTWCSFNGNLVRGGAPCSILDGWVQHTFGGRKFTPSIFFRVKRFVRYFLDLKVCLIEWTSIAVLESFGGVRNFDARHFFGCKILGSCIFFCLVRNMQHCQSPPSCILWVPPPPENSNLANFHSNIGIWVAVWVQQVAINLCEQVATFTIKFVRASCQVLVFILLYKQGNTSSVSKKQ